MADCGVVRNKSAFDYRCCWSCRPIVPQAGRYLRPRRLGGPGAVLLLTALSYASDSLAPARGGGGSFRRLHVGFASRAVGEGSWLPTIRAAHLLAFRDCAGSYSKLAATSFIAETDLTNRWSQPLAAVKSKFDFMKQLSMFAALALASGG